MGFPRNSCTSFIENRHPPFSSKGQTLGHTDHDEHFVNCHSDEDEVKLKSLLHRMFWDFGLSCFVSHGRRRSSVKDVGDDGGFRGKNLEHNTAWLLAESGGSGADEPHSVHSSFRFSLCSQVELEKMSFNPDCSSATILMVNLDNGFLTDSKSSELKWSRIESLERSISPVAHSLLRFSYSEILSITRNFSKGRVLGRGALSYVFRGTVGFLRTAVAIKRLVKDDKESSKAFCRELMVASSLDNPHIVPLLGFCIDPEGGLFLVYKYVSGGSLQQFLHDAKKGVKGGHALPWSSRYKVAVGIAEAINYLHNGTERCVVHRDIKPSNILLSSRKNPKLCDFGLASWTPAPSVPFLCKTVKGTFGYLAPEYFQHGKVSDKTDVYAFGVVLLELITGRNPIETKRGPGEENLVSWAKPLLHQGCLEKLLDPRLGSTPKDTAQIARLIQAASACINNDDSLRPVAGEVIEILRGEEHKEFSRRKAILPSRSTRMDSNSHLQLTNSEMKNHFALAMLGVEFEVEFEDDDHFYCR